MRFVICGTGGVGGTIGGLLSVAGDDVALVARGEHLAAIQADGLILHTPDESHVGRAPAFGSVSEVDWRDDDIAIVATKLQDSGPLLDELALAAPAGLTVVCAQNGLAGEVMAARRGFTPYGMMVWMPAAYLEAGVVRVHGSPTPGVLDVGKWPRDEDELSQTLAAKFTAAGFRSFSREDIMAWKRAKLKTNVVGMAKAIVREVSDDLAGRLRGEVDAVFEAMGATVTPWPEFEEHRETVRLAPAGGEKRGGGSAWQSLVRGRSSEVDYICGEVVRLGLEHGVATKANRAVQTATHRVVAGELDPRSISPVL